MRFEAQPEADCSVAFSSETGISPTHNHECPQSELSGTLYVPDTSALIENPDSLDRLLTGGNVVVLMHRVVEELGSLQASRSKSDGVRHAARQVMRKLLDLRQTGHLHRGIDRLLNGEAGGRGFQLDAFRRPAGLGAGWRPSGPVRS